MCYTVNAPQNRNWPPFPVPPAPVPVDEVRKEALRLAVEWAKSLDYLDEKITAMAEDFEEFLRGKHKHADQ